MDTSSGAHPTAEDQHVALRRWRGLIAAQIAYFEHLAEAHGEEAARGLLPQAELDWMQKEVRGWGRHLADLDGRLGTLEGQARG